MTGPKRRGEVRFDQAYLEKKAAWHRKRARVVALQKAAIMGFLVCAVLIFSLLFNGMHQKANASETGYSAEQCFANITVEQGDTLWKIAESYTDGSTAGIRICVEEIRSINNLGRYESIHAGDRLIVPYYVYKDI